MHDGEYKSLFNQQVTLMTGEVMRIDEAAQWIRLLETTVLAGDTSRKHLWILHKMAIGHPVTQQEREEAQEHGLLEPDGTVNEAQAKMMRAALRGDPPHGYYVVTPFAHLWTRTIVEFVVCCERIRSVLSTQPELADMLVKSLTDPRNAPAAAVELENGSNPFHRDTPEKLRAWADRTRRPRPQDIPPPSRN